MRVGDLLGGRYRLDQRLGQGGMGEVWRGHDLQLGRSVAVKVLLEGATGEEYVARFRREAAIGARLQHPGITVVHDVGQEDGRLFIVMELLAGEDLGSVLARERGGLPVGTALGLAAQTAEALAAAHEQSVVHRDLKPANLFLLPGGRIKVCDFGIAHSADATAGLTVTGRMFGTPSYMAPEQWLGERVDARCDLYALGCVLYALLCGQPPFGAAEPMYALARKHIEEPPPPLPAAPPALAGLLTALLAKKPADRPESARAVGELLRGLSVASPASAQVPYDPTPVDPGTAPAAATPAGVFGPAPDGGTYGPQEPPWDFVRELLREAEETAGTEPGSERERVGVLVVAAHAAARLDAGLAQRLLGDAERLAWAAGGGDGARVALLLTALGGPIAADAPARAGRLLADAQQALFTVFGSNRANPLRQLAESLAWVAPERAAGIALDEFEGEKAADTVFGRAAQRAARTDPALAAPYLARVRDAGMRESTEIRIVAAIARRDLPGALRLAEGMGDPGKRARALALAARARADAGDPTGAVELLGLAEPAALRAMQERAAVLRESAAGLASQGQLVQAERLRGVAESMLRGDAKRVGDPQADQLIGALADARRMLAQGPVVPLDAATARNRAAAERAEHPEGPKRALRLAALALECVGGRAVPWLPEVAADPGTPPQHRPVSAPGADVPLRESSRTQGLSGVPRWSTSATPGSLRRAGDGVAWLAGDHVGFVRVHNGATLWTAAADAGVPAPPLTGSSSVSLAADPGGKTVCVAVQRREGPGVRLVAREPLNGRVRWWRDLPGETPAGSPDRARFTVAGDLVLYGGREAVTALSAATGEEVWRCAGPFTDALALTAGPDCVVVADREGLTGLHLPSGGLLWPGPGPGVPGVPVGPVHVVERNAVRALHQGTGAPLWSAGLGVPASGVLARNGVVYAATALGDGRGNTVFAIDGESGRVLWSRRVTAFAGAHDRVLQLLGVRAGLLYVKSPVGDRTGMLRRQSGTPFLAALDVADGKPRWRWEHPAIGARDAVLHGDSVVLPLPALTAVALP
ncbi:protein kinase [Streptomyces sp. NPDC059385]|uniref:protein kinase domain-containing protein n=1 Tax=Streptomyces sp. NPDC059385 TaxID=3346817 RepID=UPI00369CB7E2